MPKLISRYWIHLLVVIVWAGANVPRNVGGIKGDILEAAFPLIFATYGGSTEQPFSVLYLLVDLSVLAMILAALTASARWASAKNTN